MKKRLRYLCVTFVLVGLGILIGAIFFHMLPDKPPAEEKCMEVGRGARIFPDYTGTVIPPNMAPLNFLVKEPGTRYCLKISSGKAKTIEVFSRSPGIVIPTGPWRELLGANRGGKIYFDIYVKQPSGVWSRFERITNTIAREEIDGYLVYRLIGPIYELWGKIGIYQRNLHNYDESVVLSNKSFGNDCVNCHTFHANSPASMILHVRSRKYGKGSVLYRNGEISKLDTKTGFHSASAVYVSWHPSGKAIAFSANDVTQFFHSIGENRDVVDRDSDMGLYLFETNTVTTSPEISKRDRLETYPMWSPDGRYLYFCSGPKLPYERYKEVRYDLMRIGYDLQNGTWGKLETVLSSVETGLSITQPRVSPDGRFLLFCMCEYGNFSIYQPSSDLYLMDLKTREYRRLEINSDQCESWHCWSSNGRWIVFSSKRPGGPFARPYFSYVDETGKVYKPLLLPQKDPAFYESFIKTYNLPVLIKEPVKPSERDIAGTIRSPGKTVKAKLDPAVKPRTPPGAETKPSQYQPWSGG